MEMTPDTRAEMLLLRHLSPTQVRDYRATGGFWMVSESHKVYWIGSRPTVYGEDKLPLASYCIHALDEFNRQLPKADQLLAIKLLLESNERRFWSVANKRSVEGDAPHFVPSRMTAWKQRRKMAAELKPSSPKRNIHSYYRANLLLILIVMTALSSVGLIMTIAMAISRK